MGGERSVGARHEWGPVLPGGGRRLDSTQGQPKFAPELAPKWARGRAVVTARRGWSAAFPENTMVAFTKAAEAEADVVLVDVRGTADGVPVVLHDSTLDRTTDALGAPGEYRAIELRGVNASMWTGTPEGGHRLESPAYRRMPLPTLEEVVEELAHRVGFCLELHEVERQLVEAVCELVEVYDLYEQAYVLVGGRLQAGEVRRVNRKVMVGVRASAVELADGGAAALAEAGCKVVHVRPEAATGEVLAALAEAGVWANVEPVDDEDAARQLLKACWRGVVSGRPELVVRVADELGLA